MKKATNSVMMRASNRKLVLDIVRRQPISRAGISAVTKLTRSTITGIVDELISSGLLVETDIQNSAVGRKPIHLEIVDDARLIGGINIRRSQVNVGVVTLGGNLVSSETLHYEGYSDAFCMLAHITESLKRQFNDTGVSIDKILGVGVCAPGPLNAAEGVILAPPNADFWRNVPVTEPLSRWMKMPVMLENASNALAIEEQYYGLGFGCDNFMTVQINEGIGSGVIINDRLYRGATGLGSELGHISIDMNGIPCSCGNVGCLERYAAIPALLKGSKFNSWQELADARYKDPEAGQLMHLEAKYLSTALISAINLFDVKRVILQDKICYNCGPLVAELNDILSQRTITRSSGPCRVMASQITSFVRTAAIIIIHDFYQG